MLDETVDLETVPVDRLADDICSLAGHLAAATCRWLVLLGEFDRRNGWAGPGITTCVYWLSWRCGLGTVAARDHVRVARALRSLPLVRSEFAAGRLSYSKVRAITRIATPEIEARLVDLGLACTAAHLEAVVRSYRRTTAPARRRNGGPARSTSVWWDDDGFLQVRARLAPEEGAVLMAALDAARHQLDQADRTDRAGQSDSADSSDPAAANPPTGPTPSPADECCEINAAEAFRSTLADALVAMASAALETGPVDTSGADRFQVVVHADLDQLESLRPDGAHDHAEGAGHDCEPSEELDGDLALRRGRAHIKHGPAIHPATLMMVACDAAVRVFVHGPDGSPRDTGRLHRLITAGLRRLVEERDGGCRYPGCPRRRHLHAHHIKHWANGGRTDLNNLILLCGFHHRLVHQFAYEIVVLAPGVFAFDRPDGTRIEAAPATAGHGRLDDLPASLHHAPPVTAATTTPFWAGERVDLGYVVSFLMPSEPASADPTSTDSASAGAGQFAA